mgnify:CR=1 FL=1
MTESPAGSERDKARLRRTMRTQRRNALVRAGHGAADRLSDAAKPVLRAYGAGGRSTLQRHRPLVVAGYWPTRDEIDPRLLMRDLDLQGDATALPVVTDAAAPLSFRLWAPDEPTADGAFSIPVPLEDAPWVEPDILLVPLLAFDRRGYRLGYGGGYYDRTLADARAKGRDIAAIGLALAAQQVDHVPHDDHDQRLDRLVTERGEVVLDPL